MKHKKQIKKGIKKMIIFGTKKFRSLCESLCIPGIGISATRYWFIPMYSVKISDERRF